MQNTRLHNNRKEFDQPIPLTLKDLDWFAMYDFDPEAASTAIIAVDPGKERAYMIYDWCCNSYLWRWSFAAWFQFNLTLLESTEVGDMYCDVLLTTLKRDDEDIELPIQWGDPSTDVPLVEGIYFDDRPEIERVEE